MKSNPFKMLVVFYQILHKWDLETLDNGLIIATNIQRRFDLGNDTGSQFTRKMVLLVIEALKEQIRSKQETRYKMSKNVL